MVHVQRGRLRATVAEQRLGEHWDTPQDRDEFAGAFTSYLDRLFGPPSGTGSGTALWEADTGIHLFEDTGEAAVWITAPDPTLAQILLEEIR